MMKTVPSALVVAVACTLVGCGPAGNESATVTADSETSPDDAAAMSTESPADVLLAEWQGPYGGVPPFDEASVELLEPALERGMALAREELETIAANTDEPTFANTIEALERLGAPFRRAYLVYGIYGSSLSNETVREVRSRMAPKIAAYNDERFQNKALFDRVAAIYAERDKLTPEQQRLVWDYYTEFVRRGANLDDDAKARVVAINGRLAELQSEFSNNVLHDEENYVTWLTEDDLGGLPDSAVAAARSAAQRFDGEDRKTDYAVLNTRSSMDPFLTYSDERSLREQVWQNYYSRGDNGGEYDNNAIVAEILRLREERARLLGYDNHAEYALEKQVARTPGNAMALMMKVWPAAVARVREEVADMQAVADAEGADITIQPWDYRYYAEKVRTAKYDLDQTEVKEYLQLDNLVKAMFWMAGELYGFDFRPVDGLPVFHADVDTYEVVDRDSGEHVGLFYFDPYARAGKRSGAWMNAYRAQERMNGEVRPIVSNNSNFIKAGPGEPVLVSFDDATTLFHEFGHALHGLNSDVTYRSLSGTAVPRDFVEFPSQVHENWLLTPEILSNYALHYETGEPIPEELVAKIRNAGTFRQGFDTTEYLASALVDMMLHTVDDASDIDPDEFEREALEQIGMPDELPMRHRTPQFSHLFSGEGYAARYYAYLWSDTYGADAWDAFLEADGPYDPVVAERFRKWILASGNTIEPTRAYEEFRGRPVDTDALLRQRGFSLDPPNEPKIGAGPR